MDFRWYDIFLRGTLFGYNGYQKLSSPSIAGNSYLVVDPLGHCQEAADHFHGDLIAGRIILPVLLSVELFHGTCGVSFLFVVGVRPRDACWPTDVNCDLDFCIFVLKGISRAVQ